MASEALQILNLSPIPELSEMELSTVLEQLSGLSDMNGEMTDRNVEDILREAEELIDRSASIKTDSIDSKISHKYEEIINHSSNEKSNNINTNAVITSFHDRGSEDDLLNISKCSEDNSEKSTKSKSLESARNEISVSLSDSSLSQSPRSGANHIQSALDSLRECSKKIENQTKNSPKISQKLVETFSSTTQAPSTDLESNVSVMNFRHENLPFLEEKSDKSTSENLSEELTIINGPGTCLPNLQKNVRKKENSTGKILPLKILEKHLDLNESIKTLNCFERLYRGHSFKAESKRPKVVERKCLRKSAPLKAIKASQSHPQIFNKDRKSKHTYISVKPKANKSVPDQHRFKYSSLKAETYFPEDFTEEEISFEKCLNLLNEENDSQSNSADMASFHYTHFTDKILKQYNESVGALQKEIENLRSQLKKNVSDSLPKWDSTLTQKFQSQEDIIHTLREENMKLFQEVEDIKGRLKMSAEQTRDDFENKPEKEIKTRESDVGMLHQSLITASSMDNGISRLEEQFSLLKQKYENQIVKLEGENKKLKETCFDQSSFAPSAKWECWQNDNKRNNLDSGIHTLSADEELGAKELIRSKDCAALLDRNLLCSSSGEKMDVGTSPVKDSFSQTEKERCSVSVQCESDVDLDKIENKENLITERRKQCKARLAFNTGNQMLNSMKQKKMTEHENHLMVTLRALHSEITLKEKDNKKMRNELETLRNQVKRLTAATVKHGMKKFGHIGTQTIGFGPKTQEPYDPNMFQVTKELEDENEELRSKVSDLEKMISQLKDKRIHDLHILQKLHEEEIDKLASRLSTQTALTNHLHSLLTRQ